VDKVDVFVGGMASGAELGKIPSFKKYNKVVMSTGAAGSATVEKALGPSPESDFYFHLHPWDYNQGASYAEGWDAIQKKYPNVQIKKIFLAYEEGAFGKSSWDSTKILFGADKRYTIDGAPFKSALLGGGDYTAVLEAAKAFKPDLFLWAGYDADALPLLEQSKAMKFSPGIYLGAPPGWPIGFGSSRLANNVMLYGMWSTAMNDTNAQSKKFYDAYVKRYREEPATYFALLAYDAVKILANGIKAARHNRDSRPGQGARGYELCLGPRRDHHLQALQRDQASGHHSAEDSPVAGRAPGSDLALRSRDRRTGLSLPRVEVTG
jgi:ABC-type branched-chain amino acid transport systems, periplasmic component